MEKRIEEQQSILHLKNLYFSKISFVRDATSPHKYSTKFNIQFNETSLTEIEVRLLCNITSDTEFKLEIELVGCFENTESDKKKKDEINKVNTVFIMFPYLRSEISLVTAQPNFPTIDLPVININALLEEQGELCGRRS